MSLKEILARIGRFLMGGSSSTGEENRLSPRLACQHAAIVGRGNDRDAVFIVDIGGSGLGLEGGSPNRSGDRIFISSATHGGIDGNNAVELEVVWSYIREHDKTVLTGTRFLPGSQHLESDWLGPLLQEFRSDTSSQKQKRKHVRMDSVLKAELREFETGRFLNQGEVSNISLGGLLIRSRKSMHSVPPLMVLIGPYTNYPTFFLKARLVNSRRDDDGKFFLHALEFVDKNREQNETLKALVLKMMEEDQ